MASKIRECKSCKNTRLSKPGKLVKLPIKTAKGQEVWACDFCDGPVVEMAIKQGKAA